MRQEGRRGADTASQKASAVQSHVLEGAQADLV